MISQLLAEAWKLTLEMSPYLLFGFLCAGILHVFLKKSTIIHYLAKPSMGAVFKAAIIGTPMPLCSCGVIPVAAHIHKEGASDGATISFLTSTPNTGVDSIAATYSLMGLHFAIIRPLTAIISGIVSGGLVNFFSKKNNPIPSSNIPEQNLEKPLSILQKIPKIIHYAFIESIQDIRKWLVIGILLGAAISIFLPETIVTKYLQNNWSAYFIIILVGLPMYVCSTGSIPIAMALASKGLSPGAVLVFLIVGPATNSATITYVAGKMGKKILFIYLFSLIATAVIFAIIIDNYLPLEKLITSHHHTDILPHSLQFTAAISFILLLLYSFLPLTLRIKKGNKTVFHVPSISCQGCAKKITAILQKDKQTSRVSVDVTTKKVTIYSTLPKQQLKDNLINHGYNIPENIL